ncbi:hypothetical protein [Azospirillum palustre]
MARRCQRDRAGWGAVAAFAQRAGRECRAGCGAAAGRWQATWGA